MLCDALFPVTPRLLGAGLRCQSLLSCAGRVIVIENRLVASAARCHLGAGLVDALPDVSKSTHDGRMPCSICFAPTLTFLTLLSRTLCRYPGSFRTPLTLFGLLPQAILFGYLLLLGLEIVQCQRQQSTVGAAVRQFLYVCQMLLRADEVAAQDATIGRFNPVKKIFPVHARKCITHGVQFCRVCLCEAAEQESQQDNHDFVHSSSTHDASPSCLVCPAFSEAGNVAQVAACFQWCLQARECVTAVRGVAGTPHGTV